MIENIVDNVGPVIYRKVTIGDLEKVSSPDVFLKRVQEHLRWIQVMSADAIKKIENIARHNFRGTSGYGKIHRFCKNLLEQFNQGVRSINKAMTTARKRVLAKRPSTKHRAAMFRPPVHSF